MALRNVNMELEENVIYGLLGRNGAGKTTLLNIISGSIFADTGEIEVAGKLIGHGGIPRELCYVREKSYFYGNARVVEILEMASAFHENWDWDYARELMKTFHLDGNKKIKHLSRGMESTVGNIIGLASRAPLTIFDEPVLGLDVLMRERFYQALMNDYALYPRTILFSTHLIDEIATVAEKVYIMEAGKILLHEEVENLQARSHLLRGPSGYLDAFAQGKRVIYRESYGSGGGIAVLFDTITEQEKQEAVRSGISFDELSLQKLFAYLAEGGLDSDKG